MTLVFLLLFCVYSLAILAILRVLRWPYSYGVWRRSWLCLLAGVLLGLVRLMLASTAADSLPPVVHWTQWVNVASGSLLALGFWRLGTLLASHLFPIAHATPLTMRVDATGIIRDWTSAATLLVGWESSDMLGHALEDLLSERATWTTLWDKALAHQPASFVTMVVRKDGTLLPIEMTLLAPTDPLDPTVLLTLRRLLVV